VSALEYCLTTLNSSHNKKAFNCGVESLNRYLTQQAGQDAKKGVTITYALTPINSNLVIGYYSLASSSIDVTLLPENIAKKLPRYSLLPATLLGRFAVDQHYQGKQIGRMLLLNAIKQSFISSKKIGSVAIVVDAKNHHATKFYQQHGFKNFPHQQNKLLLPMTLISQLFKNDVLRIDEQTHHEHIYS
jgi:GNAT superfamily N-acetyltransferase